MLYASDGIYGSCIRTMCKYGTMFGQKGSSHKLTPDMGFTDAEDSIPDIFWPLHVSKNANDGFFKQLAYPNFGQGVPEDKPHTTEHSISVKVLMRTKDKKKRSGSP